MVSKQTYVEIHPADLRKGDILPYHKSARVVSVVVLKDDLVRVVVENGNPRNFNNRCFITALRNK
jgi:hypothetical protein